MFSQLNKLVAWFRTKKSKPEPEVSVVEPELIENIKLTQEQLEKASAAQNVAGLMGAVGLGAAQANFDVFPGWQSYRMRPGALTPIKYADADIINGVRFQKIGNRPDLPPGELHSELCDCLSCKDFRKTNNLVERWLLPKDWNHTPTTEL